MQLQHFCSTKKFKNIFKNHFQNFQEPCIPAGQQITTFDHCSLSERRRWGQWWIDKQYAEEFQLVALLVGETQSIFP